MGYPQYFIVKQNKISLYNNIGWQNKYENQQLLVCISQMVNKKMKFKKVRHAFTQ
jgi:hypothetical protein